MKVNIWVILALVALVAGVLAYLYLERAKLAALVENRGTIEKAGTFLSAGESLWSDIKEKF